MSNPNALPQQKIYALAPLFFLLVCLAVINLFVYFAAPTPIAQTTPIPSPALSQPAIAFTPTPSTPITPAPSPTPIPPPPMPSPTFSPETAVSLLGPPPDSFFYNDAMITFYWMWPLPLTNNQQLTLYVMVDGTEQQVGTLNSPNLGEAYRLTVNLADIIETADSIQWQVRLQNNTATLTQSEWRSLNLVNSDQ